MGKRGRSSRAEAMRRKREEERKKKTRTLIDDYATLIGKLESCGVIGPHPDGDGYAPTEQFTVKFNVSLNLLVTGNENERDMKRTTHETIRNLRKEHGWIVDLTEAYVASAVMEAIGKFVYLPPMQLYAAARLLKPFYDHCAEPLREIVSEFDDEFNVNPFVTDIGEEREVVTKSRHKISKMKEKYAREEKRG